MKSAGGAGWTESMSRLPFSFVSNAALHSFPWHARDQYIQLMPNLFIAQSTNNICIRNRPRFLRLFHFMVENLRLLVSISHIFSQISFRAAKRHVFDESAAAHSYVTIRQLVSCSKSTLWLHNAQEIHLRTSPTFSSSVEVTVMLWPWLIIIHSTFTRCSFRFVNVPVYME